jgi:isopenicillin N synthase-like dioxygenase
MGAAKDERGNPDRNEFYTITRTDAAEVTETAIPVSIHERKQSIARFMSHAHHVVLTLLDSLEGPLSISRGTLSAKHSQEQPSSSQLRVIKSPAQPSKDSGVSFPSHTDLGSFTVLFTSLGGLQILRKGAANVEENWLFVKPREGCAIVNVGDTMQKYTNGFFASPAHRVVSPPGEQATETRYSIAYFIRPAATALIERLDSKVIPKLADGEIQETMTVKEWMNLLAMQKKHKSSLRGGVLNTIAGSST